MASFIAKIISKKILGETLENNFGKDDPYFETVPATRLDGHPSKSKTTKRRKALPPGISTHDAKVLTKVKRRAYRLDMSLFNCMGIRFGWSSVIGIIPGIGDVIDAFMAMMVYRSCTKVEGGLPSDVKSKMMFNIVIDFCVGLVPFLGDIADALFRANTKNAVVLETYLREKGAKALQAQGHHSPVVDPTDPDIFDSQMNSEDPPPHYATQPPTRQGTQRNAEHQAQTSRVPEQQSRSGWFGNKKQRVNDPERGQDLRRNENTAPRRNPSTLQKNRP
ncbi:PH domain-containing protein [Rhexocercosporidium sp. MPI-PUGE-AT-0058]|nr:PH domain-containing protein [Rhexocercosporidium sp. MPI-PUGE-AT-0058]